MLNVFVQFFLAITFVAIVKEANVIFRYLGTLELQ